MTGDLFDTVDQLKTRAREAMRAGDYPAALSDLGDAIALLADAHNDAHTVHPQDVHRELADCYGILGNIYRRMGDLLKALDMFERGAAFEGDACTNRTNAIILALMVDPASYANVRPTILEAVAILQRSANGARPDEWWTWSDLGLMRALSGDREGALAAFDRMQQAGAAQEGIASVNKLLGVLHGALDEYEPDLAAHIAAVRAHLSTL